MGLRPNLAFGLKPPLAGLTFFVGLAVTIIFSSLACTVPGRSQASGGERKRRRELLLLV